MAKGQKHGNREVRKPKSKKPALAAVAPVKGVTDSAPQPKPKS